MLTKKGVDRGEPAAASVVVVAFAAVVAVVVMGGDSNLHKIGPTKALSNVTDTAVPPLANPTNGETIKCNRPEGLMVMGTEWVEMSEP